MAILLAWIDLEMTGLDPAEHTIVEIATIITDDELNIIAEGPTLVIGASEDQLAKMDKVVVKMHTKSGLLEEIKKSELTVEEAQVETLKFLKEHIDAARTVPLCGNSIGMDRRFLSIYMNDVEEFLHYRSIDVSTLKELAKRWNPKVLEATPNKGADHRALADIRESIKELQHYKETFLSLAAEEI